ncbi:hypothetical protein NliqN6_2413 [Naganishia liquefaciens]|uniref:Autophagy-related protein 18 n=1 Tax=Naganishia liquefaciens TaxID=104408 RepID=A0A8H3TRC0_9TREE|nr:hypothetical protein NliqN6_2413 [Naganishia liquefaciens]
MAPIKQHPELLSCNFNQDFSCISVGTRKGYSVINCDPFGKIYSKNDGAASIVEMLFCTSLVAVVGAGDKPSASPRRLQIVNTKRQSTICELLFPTAILAVRMNRKRLIVVLELEIYIYDISTMKLLHTLDTGANPNAICALSPANDNSFLAYPAPTPSATSPLSSQPPPAPSSSVGSIMIFDTVALTATNMIQAHKSAIAALAINAQGTMLATASDKGTVIRVFSLPDAKKLGEYRRGSKAARVWSMNFNPAGTLLCVSSDTETVHVYNLLDSTNGGAKTNRKGTTEHDQDGIHPHSPPASEAPSSPTLSLAAAGGKTSQPTFNSSASASFSRRSLHLGKNLVAGMGGYMPRGVSEMWEPRRDFAYLKLRGGGGVRSVVAMSPTSPHVMVITSEGLFQSYAIDLENGGECTLVKEFPLITSDDGQNNGLES